MNLDRALEFLRTGTFQPGTMEYKWWEYWDRVKLDSTSAQKGKYRLLSEPEGVNGKEKADTNWQISNQMDNNERIAIMYLCFYYVPAEIRTQAEMTLITNLLDQGYYWLKVYGKSNYIELKLNAGFGSHAPIMVSGAAAGDQIMPRSILNGCYEVPIEIPISSGVTISSGIDWPDATNVALDGDKIYVSMVGPRWHLT